MSTLRGSYSCSRSQFESSHNKKSSSFRLLRVKKLVSRKSSKIEALVRPFEGGDLDPHYLAFFDCFNRQLYFEAHEVLEVIWLQNKTSSKGLFYKGLIQFAGAFVHLQKQRLRPAAALFRLARHNLATCPASLDHLDVADILRLIERWQDHLEVGAFQVNPLSSATAPILRLRM
jgi:hypothetical protein